MYKRRKILILDAMCSIVDPGINFSTSDLCGIVNNNVISALVSASVSVSMTRSSPSLTSLCSIANRLRVFVSNQIKIRRCQWRDANRIWKDDARLSISLFVRACFCKIFTSFELTTIASLQVMVCLSSDGATIVVSVCL